MFTVKPRFGSLVVLCVSISTTASPLWAVNDLECSFLEALAEQEGKIEPSEWRLEYEQFQREMRNRLAAESAGPQPASDRIKEETYSLDHQETLQRRTKRRLTRLRKEVSQIGERQGSAFEKDLEAGIADSDKGKLKEYQQTIWFPVTKAELERSNTFLDWVTLRETNDPVIREAQKILQEVLISDYEGQAGEGLQPKRFTNDQIREIMKKNFFLPGGLHDQPGLYDAFLEYAAFGDAPRFRNRLRYNVSHNGPGRNMEAKDGFWGFLFNVLIPGQLAQNGQATYFEGTVYWRNGKVQYPEGNSVGWFLHTATDRLQGEVNLLKFMAELSKEDMINTLATSYASTGVISQYNQLEARLAEVGEKLSPNDRAELATYIDAVRDSQRTYAEALKSRVKFAPPVNGKFDQMTITDGNGQTVATYTVDRAGGKILRNETEISRPEFFERITEELFAPVRALDPLNR